MIVSYGPDPVLPPGNEFTTHPGVGNSNLNAGTWPLGSPVGSVLATTETPMDGFGFGEFILPFTPLRGESNTARRHEFFLFWRVFWRPFLPSRSGQRQWKHWNPSPPENRFFPGTRELPRATEMFIRPGKFDPTPRTKQCRPGLQSGRKPTNLTRNRPYKNGKTWFLNTKPDG